MADIELGDSFARRILDRSGIALVLVGRDLHLIYANAAFYALSGHGPDNLRSLTLDQLIAPEDGMMPLHSGACRLLLANGSRIWVHAETTVDEGADGQPSLCNWSISNTRSRSKTSFCSIRAAWILRWKQRDRVSGTTM